MKTSEVLNTAANLIQERGWTQGPDGWGNGDPGWTQGPDNGANSEATHLCLEGGIAAAVGVTEHFVAVYDCPVYMVVADYLGRDPQPRVAPIRDALWQWNDNPDRTATEVIEVLRACALIESAREDQDAAWATYEQNVAVV